MASHRRTLAAAVATLLASVSLSPLFIGKLWFWAGAGAVAVVAAAGTLTRLRRLPVAVCLAGGVLGLLLYLNLVFASARSWGHVVPTFSSLRALWHLAGQGFDQSARYAPPVPQLHGLLLLAAAGIGITALLTDLIAVRLESAALAGLPLLLLFAEPFTVSVPRSAVGTTIAFCVGVAGYLALLSSEGRDRIREWEHPNPGPDEIPDTRALAAAGRRVGIASVVVALCVPLFIPGLHATRLFGGQTGIGGTPGPGGVGFPDPNTQLSNELHAVKNTTVLAYTNSSATPQYLQVYVLDKLTSSGWKLFSQPESLVPARPRLPDPPGLTDRSWATTVNTAITISKAVSQDALLALPVPYPTRTITAQGTLRADRFSLMVLDSGVQLAGLRYTVTSLDQSPPAQNLDNAARPPKDIVDHYMDVPSSYRTLARTARDIIATAGAKTSFQEAVALQQWLSSKEFKYTLSAPTVNDAAGLTNFLKNTKRGYCQQFSFAMAVLARLLGIPSRVAYGYTAGTFTKSGTWQVSTHDAHAWPELYFQGFGWLRFEPTPQGAAGQGTATAPAYTLRPSNAFAHNPVQALPSTTPSTPASGGTFNLTGPDARLNLPFGGAAGVGNRGGTLSPWEIFGLVLLGLLVLAVAAPVCARLAIRRRRWRSAGRGGGPGGGPVGRQRSDAALAHAAWRELRDDLVDYGAGYLPSESPRALAARAGTSLGLAEPALAALGRVALAEERARYAARPVSGAGLRQDSATIRRAIAAAVPRSTRLRARLMPSSVLTPALASISQVADIFGRLNPEWFGRAPLDGARVDRARHGLGRRGARGIRLGGIRAGRVSPANARAANDDPASRQEPPVAAGSPRQ
jgi:transglutaminase-like putative cysteine protease